MMHIMSVRTHLISYSQWTDEKDEEEFDLVHLDTAATDAAADADADAAVTFPAKIEVGHWCYCCCRNVEM